MKATITLLTFLMLTNLFLTAQNHKIGIKGGGNFNNNEMKLGYTIGLNYHYQLLNSLSVITGIEYANYKANGTIPCFPAGGACLDVITPTNNVYEFAEIPLLLSLKLKRNKESSNWNFEIIGGYSMGYMAREKRTYGEGLHNKLPSKYSNKTYHFFNAGFNVERKLSKSIHLTVGPKYKTALLENSKLQNRRTYLTVFSFDLGVNYTIGRAK
jgi:hypothetical protein